MKEEVYYKVNVRESINCDLQHQNNIDKYNKEVNKIGFENLFFTQEENGNLIGILTGVKFIDLGDTYYNEENGLYFNKNDIKIANPRLVLESYRDLSLSVYFNFFDKAKKLYMKDKKPDNIALFLRK